MRLDDFYTAGHPDAVAGAYVLLTVSDTGRGMDRATLARIFEPFFTTKDVGQGTGLGLATVYGVVRQSGGHVSVYSEPGHGTTFRIYLPVHAGAGASSDPGSRMTGNAPARAPRPGTTVLLVEDEPSLRNGLVRYLTQHGYTVLGAANGREALEHLARHTGELHAVLTDMVMPEMSGTELLQRVRSVRPGVRALLMTGYTEEALAVGGMNALGEPVLQKPFAIAELLAAVNTLVGSGFLPD